MAFTVPSAVFDQYYDVADWLINSNFTGTACTIYFPPKRISCSNCTSTWFGGVSKNVYKHGGPASFNMGQHCPLCGGNGYREEEVTASIRLRVYYRQKDWIKVGGVDITEVAAQVIGFSSDLPNLLKAAQVEINSLRYILVGQPVMHGFGKNRYFVGFLKTA